MYLNSLSLLSKIKIPLFFPGEREVPLGMARGVGSLSPRAGAAGGKKPLEQACLIPGQDRLLSPALHLSVASWTGGQSTMPLTV